MKDRKTVLFLFNHESIKNRKRRSVKVKTSFFDALVPCGKNIALEEAEKERLVSKPQFDL
jgi:hypothetical protein